MPAGFDYDVWLGWTPWHPYTNARVAGRTVFWDTGAGNMVDMGIIDPTMVVRAALENAASVANMVIITNALVADIPEKKVEAPPPQGDFG